MDDKTKTIFQAAQDYDKIVMRVQLRIPELMGDDERTEEEIRRCRQIIRLTQIQQTQTDSPYARMVETCRKRKVRNTMGEVLRSGPLSVEELVERIRPRFKNQASLRRDVLRAVKQDDMFQKREDMIHLKQDDPNEVDVQES